MTAFVAARLLLSFLPFLMSLLGRGAMAKMLCLVTGILALLLSLHDYGAVFPWLIGMTIAAASVLERIRQRRPVLIAE